GGREGVPPLPRAHPPDRVDRAAQAAPPVSEPEAARLRRVSLGLARARDKDRLVIQAVFRFRAPGAPNADRSSAAETPQIFQEALERRVSKRWTGLRPDFDLDPSTTERHSGRRNPW